MRQHGLTIAALVGLAIVLGSATWFCLAAEPPEQSQRLKLAKPGPVENVGDKADKIDNPSEILEPSSPEVRDPIGGDKIKIISKTFLPLLGMLFTTFPDGTWVDVQKDPESLTIDKNVGNKNTNARIKVSATETQAGTAGQFPMKCEGNLSVTGTGGNPPHWSAKVSKVVVELDVRENSRPTNRIGRDDPRLSGTDALARNKNLVWHNEQAHTMTFDLIKPPDISDTFMVRIEDKSGTNPGLPINFSMDTDVVTLNYNMAASGHYDCDLTVKYGLDANGNSSLSDDEVMGQYDVFGISTSDYETARYWYDWLVAASQGKMALAISRRFVNGSFPAGNVYAPTSTSRTTVVSAYSIAHPFGSAADPNGFEKLNGRTYFKANLTLPVYFYSMASDGAELVRNSTAFKQGINSFISKLTFVQVDVAYKAVPGSGTKAVDFAGVETSFAFGATGDIGLGGAGSTGGKITLNITPVGDDYRIEAGATAVGVTVEDIFDYNYFTNDWLVELTNATVYAVSIQCGFGKGDAVSDAGQVAKIEIDVSGEVATDSRLAEKP